MHDVLLCPAAAFRARSFARVSFVLSSGSGALGSVEEPQDLKIELSKRLELLKISSPCFDWVWREFVCERRWKCLRTFTNEEKKKFYNTLYFGYFVHHLCICIFATLQRRELLLGIKCFFAEESGRNVMCFKRKCWINVCEKEEEAWERAEVYEILKYSEYTLALSSLKGDTNLFESEMKMLRYIILNYIYCNYIINVNYNYEERNNYFWI